MKCRLCPVTCGGLFLFSLSLYSYPTQNITVCVFVCSSVDHHQHHHPSPAVFPKIKPFTFGDTPVFAGQSAQVACSVSEGDSPLELSWTFDGPLDVFGLGVSVVNIGTKTSLLSIDNTDSVHRGNYTCRVTNRAGRASYTAGLNVHGILTYLLTYLLLDRGWMLRVLSACDACTLSVATLFLKIHPSDEYTPLL